MMESEMRTSIINFLNYATVDNLYPLIAYGMEDNTLVILTVSVTNLSTALRIMNRTQINYNIGKAVWISKLCNLVKENKHVFKYHEMKCPGLNHDQHGKDIGKTLANYGASFYEQKAIGLVDLVGFSKLNENDQLVQLYSLNRILQSSIRRTSNLINEIHLPVSNVFHYSTTGDGFYLWHEMVGGASDVATCLLLCNMMTQAEAIRNEFLKIRLKGSFIIDSVYLFFNPVGHGIGVHEGISSTAIGPATNRAARMMSKANPGQLLVADFSRSGRDEKMTPHTLIDQVNEIYGRESGHEHGHKPASLTICPEGILRVTDKHNSCVHCYNVVGRIPNTTKRGSSYSTDYVEVGVKPDTSKDLAQMQFLC